MKLKNFMLLWIIKMKKKIKLEKPKNIISENTAYRLWDYCKKFSKGIFEEELFFKVVTLLLSEFDYAVFPSLRKFSAVKIFQNRLGNIRAEGVVGGDE